MNQSLPWATCHLGREGRQENVYGTVCYVVRECTKCWARIEMKSSQGKGMVPEVDYRLTKKREGRALQIEAVRSRQVMKAQQHVARFWCWWQGCSMEASGQKWHWQIWEPGSHGPCLLSQRVCPLSSVSRKSIWSFKHRCEQMWVLECSGSSEGYWRQAGQSVGIFPAKGDKAIRRSWKCFQSYFPWVFPAVVYM